MEKSGIRKNPQKGLTSDESHSAVPVALDGQDCDQRVHGGGHVDGNGGENVVVPYFHIYFL
jgi:hypothetical protein